MHHHFNALFRDADRVLITAGAGLSIDAGNNYWDKKAFRERFPAMASRGYEGPYQFIGKRDWSLELKWGYSASFAKVTRDLPLAAVYSDLLRVLEALHKDYFVVTSNVDNFFHKHGFDQSRIYTPQGQIAKMQCLDPWNCPQKAWDSDPIVDEMYANVDFTTQELRDPGLVPRCPQCGGEVFFNVDSGMWYVRDAYLDAKRAYESWVEDCKTANESLVVLEIGVGFWTPKVIRYPNEELVAEHENSWLIRVNPKNPEVPDKIAERSIGIPLGGGLFVQVLRDAFLEPAIMDAAWLETVGQPIFVNRIPEPQPRAIGGSVKVKHLYSGISNLDQIAYSGRMDFPIPVPLIPGRGAVGIVEGFAADVRGLSLGERVFCSPWYVPRRSIGDPFAAFLMGLSPMSADSGCIPQLYKNGGLAEKGLWPVSCVFPLPEDMKRLSLRGIYYIEYLSIAMRALNSGSVGLASSVLVNGATGRLGCCAVKLAMALGATKVYAVGRSLGKLKRLLGQYDHHRLSWIRREEDIPERAVDAVIDFLGNSEDGNLVTRCLRSLRFGGVLVCAGGMKGALQLSYQSFPSGGITIRGSLMYRPEDVRQVIALIRSGKLEVEGLPGKDFALAEVRQAIAEAEAASEAFFGIKF